MLIVFVIYCNGSLTTCIEGHELKEKQTKMLSSHVMYKKCVVSPPLFTFFHYFLTYLYIADKQ